MANVAFLFSIVFFLFFIMYISLGMYVFLTEPKDPIRKVLFAMLIALSLWTFGFTIAISASDYEACLFWRRFAALGWGSFFSFLLHFSLLFTEKKVVLKKWWVYILIYFPALISIFAFSLSNNLAPTLYYLVNTQWGWINVAQNTSWDIFYAIYYSVYSLISMTLILRWGLQKNESAIKKQAMIIIGSYFLVFLLVSLTDILCNAYLGITIPQMAPLFMIFPVFIMFYNKNYFGLIAPRYLEHDGGILNVIAIKEVYVYLSIAMILGGMLNFVTTVSYE